MNLLKKFLSEELHINPELYIDKFLEFDKLLLDWNTKINLISRKSISIEDHILNSIFFLTKHDLTKVRSLADIGTGGGFPGIPLKILYPEMDLLLLDSIKKKILVVEDIVEQMNLENVKVVCGRAEEVKKDPEFRNKYDAVISKAVAPLSELYEWGKGLINQTGETLCIKGGDITEELSLLNKKKYNFKAEVINFEPDISYGIEDKKLVVIKRKSSI
ncbi:MAG TPA: 16S rRNA (guanine(527)-N(7))-methyltransferase RsmG [Ignavibacteria bacterium]|nr:16S rRNA (guanine(527)-N(7))-methyltransferase RsmG [Ignavibacteria bacterium]HMR40300.1 16S rRNA (guanine(527)-N(7))-methyltransferase RsmG [Ignavibacteria bacterium]